MVSVAHPQALASAQAQVRSLLPLLASCIRCLQSFRLLSVSCNANLNLSTGSGLTGLGAHGSSGHHTGHHGAGHVEDIVHGGPHHTETANKLDPHVSGPLGSSTTGTDSTGSGYGSTGTGYDNTGTGSTGTGYGSTGTGYDNTGTGSTGAGYGSTGTGYDNTGTGSTGTGYDNTGTTGKKPGLMDKLNPIKDTDHDGKKGVME